MTNLILVDQNDNQLGTQEKLLVHQQGLLHRAFSIFVFRKHNNNLELLLQKRHKKKYHSGGLWTNSCCGHPEDQEDLILAGERRIKEELGIQVKLISIGNFIYRYRFTNGLLEHELDHVLIGNYQNDIIIPDVNEVEEFKWINKDLFETWLLSVNDSQQYKNIFTVWLVDAWKLVKANFIQVEQLFN